MPLSILSSPRHHPVYVTGSAKSIALEKAIQVPRRLIGVALNSPAEIPESTPTACPTPPVSAATVLVSEPPPPVPVSPATLPAVRMTPSETQEEHALRQVLKRILGVVEELREQQQQRLMEMQQVAIELAVAIASHLMHEQIEQGRFPIEQVVRRVLERLPDAEKVTVYLHPDDLATLHQRLAETPTSLASWLAPTISLAADPHLARGDCRAETPEVQVRSLLDQQLADVRAQLLSTLPETKDDSLLAGISGRGDDHAS